MKKMMAFALMLTLGASMVGFGDLEDIMIKYSLF